MSFSVSEMSFFGAEISRLTLMSCFLPVNTALVSLNLCLSTENCGIVDGRNRAFLLY